MISRASGVMGRANLTNSTPGGGLRDRLARVRHIVRQFDDGAHRAASVHGLDDFRHFGQRQGAERATRGVFAIDDVGAPRHGDLRLGARQDAGEHQGHRILLSPWTASLQARPRKASLEARGPKNSGRL